MQSPQRRGVALIVVLVVLALLALVGTMFSQMSYLERRVSTNYLEEVRARLVARSGIENAYVQIQQALNRELFTPPDEPTPGPILRSLRFYGQDVLEKGDDFALLNVPLEEAKNPSLAVEALLGNVPESPQNPYDSNPMPLQIKLGDRTIGISGAIPAGHYGANSDVYSLRITDANGMIHLNDGIREQSNFGSVSRNLRRIINKLGVVLSIPKLGDRILDARPPAGFADKKALIPILGRETFDRVAPFLTANAWIDHNVVQPVPLSEDTAVLKCYKDKLGFANPISGGPYYRGMPARFRYGRGKNRDGVLVPDPLRFAPEAASPDSTEHAIWGIDELNPQWIEVCARAPVNLNLAAREILVALLADLQGFWVADRQRNNPNCVDATSPCRHWNNGLYHTFDGGAGGLPGGDGDEMGFLYTTDPIVFTPGTAVASANSAAAIADEMIACRESQRSKLTGFDYNRSTNPAAWFGGPFRTWRQFYAFCDHLVPLGLVRETRSIFHSYLPPGTGLAGGGAMAPTNGSDPVITAVEGLAAQAIADVIKSNFNPNCHLNETNPDENMSLLVDKTDLICMSTEGSLMPAGYFEIESLGRVLRPNNFPADSLKAGSNKVVAEAKCFAVIKLYDCVRFTSQKDFYEGEISPRRTLPETNNGMSLEIGPEPDNGLAPRQVEWDGYIALPTQGGSGWATAPGGTEMSFPKPKGTPAFTPTINDSEYGVESAIHSHFQYDVAPHYHLDGVYSNLAQVALSNENFENRPDRTETIPGPYVPNMGGDPAGGGGSRHRLARSFRIPEIGTNGSAPTSLVETAPMDLRIDGCYLERDANVAYWTSRQSLSGYQFEVQFLNSFWMKPNFYPETTQKVRKLWGVSRVDMRKNLWDFFAFPVEPAMLDLYMCPSQYPDVEFQPFTGSYTNWYPTRPSSLLFMHSASYMTHPLDFGSSLCYALSVATQTKTLNHHFHGAQNGWTSPHTGIALTQKDTGYRRDNPMAAHRWMHVIVACKTNWASPEPNARLWVNGKWNYQADFSPRSNVYPYGLASSTKMDWVKNFKDDNTPNLFPYGDMNLMRIGQPNRITAETWADGSAYNPRHNFSCDSTLDEMIHFKDWGTVTEGAALAQWQQGRYHIPRTSTEGVYTSHEFTLPIGHLLRSPPPPSGASHPTGSNETQAAPPSPSSSNTTVAMQLVKPRVLGMAWTLFGETHGVPDPNRRAEIVDGNTLDLDTPEKLKVKTEMSLSVDGIWHGPYTGDDFSRTLNLENETPIEVRDFTKLKFKLRFTWEDMPPLTSFILATPYVDDVTIFFDAGDSGFVQYHML